jgi:DNA-binding MarR family transcriptional regulator
VTAEGRELLERYDDLRVAELRALLEGFSPDRRPEAVSVLADFAGTGTGAGSTGPAVLR